jgi:hypothetical protein
LHSLVNTFSRKKAQKAQKEKIKFFAIFALPAAKFSNAVVACKRKRARKLRAPFSFQ